MNSRIALVALACALGLLISSNAGFFADSEQSPETSNFRPERGQPDVEIVNSPPAGALESHREIEEEKLSRADKIILPKLVFANLRFDEAVNRLQKAADVASPTGQPIKVRLMVKNEDVERGTMLTMNLSESSLSEAARLVAAMAQCRMIDEGDTLTIVPLHADYFIEVSEIADAFNKAGLVGTFVLLDSDGAFRGHNEARAGTRYVPASTFKIPNSLIGLDCGAVSSVDEILPYGGKPQFMKEWEHDMGLRAAIKISNVPIYQELARRIGLDRMKTGVDKLDYGNKEIGDVVDQFWLVGPLKISAIEQTRFLRRLALQDLPMKPEAMEAVREITLLDTRDGAELHGKTGYTGASLGIGWFVGWVEKGGKVYPFALNIDMKSMDLAPKRVSLAKECLEILGIYPSQSQDSAAQ